MSHVPAPGACGDRCTERVRYGSIDGGSFSNRACTATGAVTSEQPRPPRREEKRAIATTEVNYSLDDGTLVRFEIDPGTTSFRPAGPDEIAGRTREAVTPAVEGAWAVLEKVKEAAPQQIEVKFGIKVSGTANWLVAKAATEGNFEITLTWNPDPPAGT